MRKHIRSFDPVASRNARIVILGSMPGERSLTAGEYYAHPRNGFWKIMQEVVGVDAGAPYENRLRSLTARGIALWDVLHSCYREGSLDAAIKHGTVKINDFNTFFRRHPGVGVVLFNGGTSEHYYKRYVMPELQNGSIVHLRMPSTSPAYAAMPLKRKVEAWRSGIDAVNQTSARASAAEPASLTDGRVTAQSATSASRTPADAPDGSASDSTDRLLVTT